MGRTILSAMLGLFLGVAAAYAEDVVTEPIIMFSAPGSITSVAFAPDGTIVLTGGDNTARLWDTATGACIRTFVGHADSVRSAAFSPNGANVVTASDDETVKLWHTATGAHMLTFVGHADDVNCVTFSPDGTEILSGGDDGTARLWNAFTGSHIRTFSGHTYYVLAIAFSPDGSKIVTGSGDQTLRLWDRYTGAPIRTLGQSLGWVESVAFSPDGTRVLAADGRNNAWLWDISTGELIQSLVGHSATVMSVAFSPDGTKVLTGAGWADKTARLWDAATGAHIRTFRGHMSSVTSVAFSPDGTKVLTGSADRTARLWDVGPQLLIRSAPITGVAIAGDAPGVTDFSRTYYQTSQSVTLTAPPVALSGAVRYDFIRWEIDGQQQPQAETSVQFMVEGVMTAATAVYEIRTHTLTVVSQALAGLDIMGDHPGKTPYCATGTDQEAVHLALDEALSIVSDDQLYNFVYWMIDGVPQPRGCTSVDIVMDADRTATAVYNLLADANGDCVVNVLDLIFVRNRLGERPYTGDNWRADITCDMVINVLDLIAVRNYLGTRCGE